MTDELLDRMLTLSSKQGPSTTCKTCALLADLSAEGDERLVTVLSTALNTKRVQATAIARVMKEEGYPISDSSIRRHRRGGCLAGQAES